MNKFLIKIIFLTSLSISIATCAQSNTEKNTLFDNRSDKITFNHNDFENIPELNLSSEQIRKIKKIKQNIEAKFETIGINDSLSGYEKGQQKKALVLQYKKDIYNILTPKQKALWKNNHDNHDRHDNHNNHKDSIKDNITNTIDNKLDALEDKYKADKKAIERNSYLSQKENKIQKKALEATYKREKELLKNEKDSVKHTSHHHR